MAHKKHTDHKIAAEHDVWRALMLIIYMVLLGVILSLGYLLVGHHLHSYWHSESLSPEQLQKVQQQASARLSQQQELADWDRVVDGVHLRTGLRADENLPIVIAACTSCHSGQLVAQNKATREGWQSMIRWMQATQGLQDLGSSEPAILDYLAKHYAPQQAGRRPLLAAEDIEWYVLSLE